MIRLFNRTRRLGSVSMERSLSEAALWCSLQELKAIHEDSPEETRRRGMVREAARLMSITYKDGKNEKWFESPEGIEAMSLLKEANPDSLAPLEDQLRSEVFKPAISIGDFYSEEEREQTVAKVVEVRSTLLELRLGAERDRSSSGSPGKLLLYLPSENVSDGASRYASNGFYDMNDAPPWDTWVEYSDRTLTCWVPEPLVSLAQLGIDANPVDCIHWAA